MEAVAGSIPVSRSRCSITCSLVSYSLVGKRSSDVRFRFLVTCSVCSGPIPRILFPGCARKQQFSCYNLAPFQP
jgi:hypothetical protein